jgi:hypothetical protein
MDHGARIDRSAGEIDRGGAINTIPVQAHPPETLWQATTAYLVQGKIKHVGDVHGEETTGGFDGESDSFRPLRKRLVRGWRKIMMAFVIDLSVCNGVMPARLQCRMSILAMAGLPAKPQPDTGHSAGIKEQ